MKAIIVLSLLISSAAFAGPQGSGGGKAVVCRDSKKRIKSVELLDLWEAREVYRFKVKSSKASVAEQVKEKIQDLKYATQISHDMAYFEGDQKWTEPEYIANWLGMISKMFLEQNKKYVYIMSGAELLPTDDSFEVAIPKGNCKIEQIVNYVDSTMFPRILVDGDLLAKMDNTNKAALYLHEAFYVFLRGYSGLSLFDQNRDQNSIRVRRAIGYVFGGNKFLSLNALLPDRFVQCHGQNAQAPTMPSTFYVWADAAGNSHAITTQLFGKRMIGYVEENLSTILPDGLVNQEACNEPGPPDRNQQGPGVFNLFGSGPVDYQMQVWLAGDCDKYKQVMMLMTDRYIGPKEQEAQQLSCRWVDKSENVW